MLTIDEPRRSTAAFAFRGSTFAGPDEQDDCEAVGGVWNADSKTCSK
jgi:hypothetical protein